jgi:hypothetical protein
MEEKENSLMNWVDRRALRERNLDDGAPKVWDQVRGAIQDSCDSFNEHYKHPNQESAVDCKLENGRRVKVSRIVPANLTTTFQP